MVDRIGDGTGGWDLLSVRRGLPGRRDSGSAVAEARGPASAASPAEARRVASEFETMMVGMLVKSMRQGGLERGIFGEGAFPEMFQGMFDEAIGRAVVERGGLGLADRILSSWGIDSTEGDGR